MDNPAGNFHLSKWFLDFIGNQGEVMIFYAARLKWHGWSASYTSWLKYTKTTGVILKSRFSNVHIPMVGDESITWKDSKFGVSGIWTPLAKRIEARLFESTDGYLDWKCFQPDSKVELRIGNSVLSGRGYAEQLILTAPPWLIPMDELRWGRFASDQYNIVWIEIREKVNRQWLWANGVRIENCIIDDDRIYVPVKDLLLHLDRAIVLESEKKILSVVNRLIRYLPGFKKIMPVKFLIADETKWASSGKLQQNNKDVCTGYAIHELVNFNAR